MTVLQVASNAVKLQQQYNTVTACQKTQSYSFLFPLVKTIYDLKGEQKWFGILCLVWLIICNLFHVERRRHEFNRITFLFTSLYWDSLSLFLSRSRINLQHFIWWVFFPHSGKPWTISSLTKHFSKSAEMIEHNHSFPSRLAERVIFLWLMGNIYWLDDLV